MIEFFSVTPFELPNADSVKAWISNAIKNEDYALGELTFIFCDDDYLHRLNVEFLNHDTLTDIITFDNSLGKEIYGEIYISIDRVTENAEEFKAPFSEELHRVIIHGVLHLCGYKDKSIFEEKEMRGKETQYLQEYFS